MPFWEQPDLGTPGESSPIKEIDLECPLPQPRAFLGTIFKIMYVFQ